MGDVLRVIGAGFVGDPKVRAVERGTKLRHKLLDGIRIVSEPFALGPVKPGLRARPMG
jgi:hypothetical protein